MTPNVGLGGAVGGGAGGNGGSGLCGAIVDCTSFAGSKGGAGGYTIDAIGGAGGNSFFAGGVGATARGNAGGVPSGNSGSGGSGGGGSASVAGGGGGGSGGYVEALILNPGTISYAIGTGGGGGNAGTSGFAGGAGAAGYIEITEYFSTSDVIDLGIKANTVIVNTASTVAAQGGSAVTVLFTNEVRDTLNQYDPATGYFTPLESGVYRVSYGLRSSNFVVPAAGQSWGAYFDKGLSGSYFHEAIYVLQVASVSIPTAMGRSFDVELNAGQILRMRIANNAGVGSGNITLNGDPLANYMTITRMGSLQ
jgi:hypothetical protein